MKTARNARTYRAVAMAFCTAAIGVAAVVAVHSFSGTSDAVAPISGPVRIAGSETMRPVVTICAEDFMIRNPQSDIIVRGGGSGDEIAALLHGLVDIGMASRDLTARERDYAASQGVRLAVTALALDGISIIVGHGAPIAILGIDQLRSIFEGKIQNWRELGGDDADIVAFARAEGSGTAFLFANHVLGDKTYGSSVRRLWTNEAIVNEVATRANAIGYADVGATKLAGDRIKVLALRRGDESSPILPTFDAIREGAYPLARTLYLVSAESASGVAKAFLEFSVNPRCQALVQKAGYVGRSAASE